MNFFDILQLSLRNLRGAKLRATLTTGGVIIGVAVIVTMVSFGLGLRRDALSRFQQLDAFSEVHVYGRSLLSMAADREPRTADPAAPPAAQQGDDPRIEKIPERSLDDRALEEIARIPGVTFVSPHILFSAYARSNGRTQMLGLSGALDSDPSARFKEFAAGKMLEGGRVDEAVVNAGLMRAFGYRQPSDAVGQTLELLDAAQDGGGRAQPEDLVVARTYRIVGVLKEEAGGNRFRGAMPVPDVYLPMPEARSWKEAHHDRLNQVALRLARKKGSVGEQDNVPFTTAVLRVEDPVALSDVRRRLAALGFGSFSFIDEFKQVQTTFLVINSALGLLGGISLLVASLGITNTMLMSILERTREIGIMKAIGAKDMEIKLIFFVEAAVIGLTGGAAGALLAWGIDALSNRLVNKFILEARGVGYIDLFSLPAYLWLGALLFAVVVSIAAALYPAARAARVDPVTALRHD